MVYKIIITLIFLVLIQGCYLGSFDVEELTGVWINGYYGIEYIEFFSNHIGIATKDFYFTSDNKNKSTINKEFKWSIKQGNFYKILSIYYYDNKLKDEEFEYYFESYSLEIIYFREINSEFNFFQKRLTKRDLKRDEYIN